MAILKLMPVKKLSIALPADVAAAVADITKLVDALGQTVAIARI